MHIGLHHAVKRRKQKVDDLFDRFMIVVGLTAPAALFPQVWKLWADHSAVGISLISWCLLTLVSMAWAIYGFVRHSKALWISNVLMTILNLAVVVAVLSFR
jgi:uncharacterized protein with PQ loop repeat